MVATLVPALLPRFLFKGAFYSFVDVGFPEQISLLAIFVVIWFSMVGYFRGYLVSRCWLFSWLFGFREVPRNFRAPRLFVVATLVLAFLPRF